MKTFLNTMMSPFTWNQVMAGIIWSSVLLFLSLILFPQNTLRETFYYHWDTITAGILIGMLLGAAMRGISFMEQLSQDMEWLRFGILFIGLAALAGI